MDRPPLSSDAVDDDIIDLTDIVEKGAVPDETVEEANPLEAQMADLLAGSGKVPNPDEDEFDLDALLQSTVAADAGADSSEAAPSAAAEDEGDEMPDMAGVDALLRDLVVPEQPAASAPEPEKIPAAAPAGEDADADDLDSLLASLDMPGVDAAPSAASAPPTPDESAAVRAEPVEPALTAAAPAGEDADTDDLDSLLASLDMPGVDAAPSAAPARPAPDESAAVRAEPVEPAPAAEPEVDVDDLDSLLDSIMNPESESLPAAPNDENSPGESGEGDADLADLDALLTAAQESGLSSMASAEAAFEALPEEAERDSAPAPVAPLADAGPEMSTPQVSVASAGRGETFAQILESMVEGPDVVAPAVRAEPGAMEEDGEFDLDALLRGAAAEVTASPEEAAPSLPSSGKSGDDEVSGGGDALFQAAELDAAAAGVMEPEEFSGELPMEQDLGDPLLIGEESPRDDEDLGAVLLNSLNALSADITAMQDKINSLAAAPPLADFDDLRAHVEDLQAEVRDMADGHAGALAAAEARISALEAELAEKDARGAAELLMPPEGSSFRAELAGLVRDAVARALQDAEYTPPYVENLSEDMVRLEDRLSAVERGGEKAAAEAAARVIREEIAALAADLAQEE